MMKLIKQLIKFGFVGGSAFIIDYFTMILLTECFGINYLLSSAVSFTISVIYNYILSIKWVFAVNDHLSQSTQFIVFIILSVIGLGLNTLLMWVFVQQLGINYMISKIIVTAIVMVYNFITRKLFLEGDFNKKSKPESGSLSA